MIVGGSKREQWVSARYIIRMYRRKTFTVLVVAEGADKPRSISDPRSIDDLADAINVELRYQSGADDD